MSNESDSVLATIARFGVVPVIAIDSVDAAIPLADALLEGGLALVEITFRTAAAAEVIEKITAERPEMLVGAGTVLSIKNLETAKAVGARFGVAPGLNPDVIFSAQEIELPFIPGVCTASEIEGAMGLGCMVLKYFPAELNGGVEMLKALSGPYAHTGVRFMPTGGVSPANLESYLAIETVAAVGGTWIAKRDDLAAGRWSEIRDRCRRAVETVRRVRG
jgi:2-dehydro-3-deoxyphosphogluconate aldolase/(4S)-4-hydroxy-2-oxoglutarate aldolase